MTKTLLLSDLNSMVSELDSLIDEASKQPELSADGHLLCHSRKGNYEYQCHYDDGRTIYLRKGDELIKSLAQKHHLQKVLEVAQRERAQLQKCAKILNERNSDTSKVHLSLNEGIRRLTEPFKTDDDSFASEWLKRNSAFKRQTKTLSGSLKTATGEYVKSKSELIIADKLFHAGVPFVYEMTFSFDNGNTFLYPDFVVLNKRTRETFLWEHLGKMDDPDYCMRNQRKIESFGKHGFYPGKNMILTMESSLLQISTEYVDGIIREFLI